MCVRQNTIPTGVPLLPERNGRLALKEPTQVQARLENWCTLFQVLGLNFE